MLSVHLYCVYQVLVFNALNAIVADMEDNIMIDRLPLAHGTARAISFSIVHATTLWQSVYPDIALHISNYYIHIVWCYFDFSSFLWSQITVYMAINIEWKYQNDTSFDNGIHFHVSTMVLKCKFFCLP
jgi:hypothetical protein